jgi:hypothetical protein
LLLIKNTSASDRPARDGGRATPAYRTRRGRRHNRPAAAHSHGAEREHMFVELGPVPPSAIRDPDVRPTISERFHTIPT